jgi:glutathione S-transferase
MIELSPSVRAVLLTAKALNIEFERVRLNVFHADHKKQEFTDINPMHTVPTFVDNDGTVIYDSHAIMIYLVEKYGKDPAQSLYPKDCAQRAYVNMRLFFECGNFSNVHQQLYYKMWTKEMTTPSTEQLKHAQECYELIEQFLTDKDWLVGDQVTLADLSMIATLSSMMIRAPVDPKFESIARWMRKCEELPYYEEANGRYVKAYRKILDDVCENKGEIHIEWIPEP